MRGNPHVRFGGEYGETCLREGMERFILILRRSILIWSSESAGPGQGGKAGRAPR